MAFWKKKEAEKETLTERLVKEARNTTECSRRLKTLRRAEKAARKEGDTYYLWFIDDVIDRLIDRCVISGDVGLRKNHHSLAGARKRKRRRR